MAGYSVTFSVVDQATAQIEAINRRVRQMREPLERQARAAQRFMGASGLRRMAEGFGDLGRRVVGVFSSLSRLVPVLGALTGAASIAGMTRLVNTWGQFGLQLQRDATRIGTTSQNLQQLQTMTRLAGGSADDMTESLKGLSTAAADAITGRNVEALAWFNRANIDVNAALRDTTQVLPQVLEYIAGLKNPTDQMTAAMGLGGQSLYNLVQTFREAARPGETLLDTYRRLGAEAARHATLTDRQIAAQRRYKEAIDALNVTMDELGQQVGTVLAEAFTPLVREFGTFVQEHQPAIVRAVRELAEGFRDWLAGVDIEQLMVNLRALADLLRGILRIVGAVARALAPIINLLTLTPRRATAEEIIAGSPLAAALPEAEQARILGRAAGRGETREVVPGFGDIGRLGLGTWAKQRLGFGRERVPITGGEGQVRAMAQSLPAEARGLLDTIAGTESGGRNPYTQLYGGANIELAPGQRAPGVPIRSGPNAGRTSSAYGRYQFINPTWETQARKLGLTDRSPEAQDVAAWDLAKTRYGRETGRDLLADLQAGRHEQIGPALRKEWTSLPGGIEQARGNVTSAFANRLAQNIATQHGLARAAPPTGDKSVLGTQTQLAAAAPAVNVNLPQAEGRPVEVTGGPPVSGSVDITVTHKNPPPGATVRATGTGDVNVATPRTEQQALAAA